MITKTYIYNKVKEAGKRAVYLMMTPLLLASCVDTVILPDNKTVDEDYWQKKSEVQTLVATAYAQLRDATAIRNMIVWGDFRSDELVMTSSLPSSAAYKTELSQIYSLNIETENRFTAWYPFYSAINYCNLVLEKAEGVIAVDPDYTQGDYDANKAQVLALRAFCYFYLSRVFHDIPVTPHAYLNSSDDLNARQATPDSVLTMCIDDLKEASRYAGINANRNIILSMIIAGALSGLGGGLYYLAGTIQYVLEKSVLGMGFDGIPVALLANSHPIGTIFSSLFISYIKVGGSAMQPNFSSETINIIIAVIIYLAAFALLMRGVIMKLLKKLSRKSDKEVSA